MEVYTERIEAKKRAEREALARKRQGSMDRQRDHVGDHAQAEHDAQVAALRRLRPALDKALREPIGDLRSCRIAARSFLHGQVAGTFHQLLPGQSPRSDALQGVMVAIAALTTTSALTGRQDQALSDPQMLAELDTIECAVWRALVDTARIIAGEMAP